MPLAYWFSRAKTGYYRGREDRFYCGLPSLRTGRAQLTHPALRLLGSLQRLTRQTMGLYK